MEQIQFDFNKEKSKRVELVKCECCGHIRFTYTRKFNSNMAVTLLALYKHNVNGYVKVEEFLLEHGYKRCGDFSYLVHYRLLEKQKGKRDDGSKKNGYYRLTALGILFVEGKHKVKESFIISENKLLGFSEKEIDIKQALGEKFNYSELIQQSCT